MVGLARSPQYPELQTFCYLETNDIGSEEQGTLIIDVAMIAQA